MTTLALAFGVAAAIVAPHALRLTCVSPAVGATIWMCALALRALTAVFFVGFLILVVPSTAFFNSLTHWCWDTVIPLIAQPFGLDGHQLGDAAMVAPALVLAASLVWVVCGLARAWHAVQRWTARSAVRRSRDTVVVASSTVLLGATGLARPRVVVSEGALAAFDDEELAAGMAHERGHIARRHRFVLIAAEACRAVGRFIPGSRRAAAELVFHLERDADRWALERRHAPAALASAILKAATHAVTPSAAFAPLSGGALRLRVEQLVDDRPRTGQLPRVATGLLATVMALLTIALVAATPAAIAAGLHTATAESPVEHCVND